MSDQMLAGDRLVLRQSWSREFLGLVVRDDVFAPIPGRSDDPLLSAGRLEIGNPETGEWAAFDLPSTTSTSTSSTSMTSSTESTTTSTSSSTSSTEESTTTSTSSTTTTT